MTVADDFNQKKWIQKKQRTFRDIQFSPPHIFSESLERKIEQDNAHDTQQSKNQPRWYEFSKAQFIWQKRKHCPAISIRRITLRVVHETQPWIIAHLKWHFFVWIDVVHQNHFGVKNIIENVVRQRVVRKKKWCKKQCVHNKCFS